MKPRRIKLTEGFVRAVRSLPAEEREAVRRAVNQYIDRSAENALRVERKSGLLGIWAFRVSRGTRVFFVQQHDSDGRYSELFHVGPHEDYATVKRKRPR